jgi:signal transduction histidine kinase/ABC-type multidrug transport system ATPase subunit
MSALASDTPGGDGRGLKPAGHPLLRLTGITKRFGQLRVLDGVDLSIGLGELLALVGENGAGKSTIVKCIAGVVTPESGSVLLDDEPLTSGPSGLQSQGIAVVWQDLALCDNLDTVANLFLGRERRRLLLRDDEMHVEARRLLFQLGIRIDDLSRPVGLLSGGQRQSIALARATMARPRLLILDEPTASLGVTESLTVGRLIRRFHARGTTILLVTHDLEQAFQLADRIAVLRQGRIVARLHPREVHPDDVVALMSGAEVDSTARKQLQRLQSLVDQLSETEPAASLPLIVSAMASALGQEKLCVHLLHDDGDGDSGGRWLRLIAAVGLPPSLVEINHHLPVGYTGGPAGLAAATDDVVVVEDVRSHPLFGHLGPAVVAAGAVSAWAAPIVGSGGVIGTVSGYGETVGRPAEDQLQLVSLYAGHAAAAIERERLLDEATRRNRVLETIREILEILAGPELLETALTAAMLSLCRGLGADAVSIYDEMGRVPGGIRLAITRWGTGPDERVTAQLTEAAERCLDCGSPATAPAINVGGDILATRLDAPEGRAVLSALWLERGRIGPDTLELLNDASRSLQLAFERESLMIAQQKAAALRRSHDLQRQFLSRLSHELRTPLTAVEGYASTLRQQDVVWDADSQRRFLDRISTESGRMVRLVGDLLDSSAIEAGILRVHPDWCDLPLVLEAAISCLPPIAGERIQLSCHEDIPPIWADHDRLEQLFVNLVENSIRHTPEGTRVAVSAHLEGGCQSVVVKVADDGPGIPPDLADRMFLPHERGATTTPGAGLGLWIASGIADAHGGRLRLCPVPHGTCFEVDLPVDPPANGAVGLVAERP